MPDFETCDGCGEAHEQPTGFTNFMDHIRDVVSGGQLVAREGVRWNGVDVTVVAVLYPGSDDVSAFAVVLTDDVFNSLEFEEIEDEAKQILSSVDFDAPIPFLPTHLNKDEEEE